MQAVDALTSVECEYDKMVERVSTYYFAYVDTMWSVVALHTKLALGHEQSLWPQSMPQFEDEFAELIELELHLATMYDRDEGMGHRVMLDDLHAKLEHDLMMELLAQPDMTVPIAIRLSSLSKHRLQRHMEMRKELRRQIDAAVFHVSDVEAKCERDMPEAKDAMQMCLAYLKSVQPNVIPQ